MVSLLLDGNVSVTAAPGTPTTADSATTNNTSNTSTKRSGTEPGAAERRLELWNRVVVIIQELGQHSVVSQDLQELFSLLWVRDELLAIDSDDSTDDTDDATTTSPCLLYTSDAADE